MEYQAHNQSGLLLNANENPDNLDPSVLEEVIQALPDIQFNRYPEDEASALKQAYSNYVHVPESWILAGSGSDQMLQLLIGAFGGPGKTIVTLSPDFGMYDFYAGSFSTDLLKYPIDLKNGVDLEDFASYIREVFPSLVVFSNPNNPTGSMLSSKEIKMLADAIAPIPLAADEAYMEFGKDSAIPYLESTPNLYITRTLSKAFGLAGLRVGFLLSRPENIKKLAPFKIVYNLSSLSQKIAEIALGHTDLYQKQVDAIIKERDALKQALQDLEIECGPAAANYLCLYPTDPLSLSQAFEQAGIQIRSYPGKPYIRITIGTPKQNQQVLEVIRAWKSQTDAQAENTEAGFDTEMEIEQDPQADCSLDFHPGKGKSLTH